MSLPSIDPTQTNAWKALADHFLEMKGVEMSSLFFEDQGRGGKMHVAWEEFYVDYSKNRVTNKTLQLLKDLANEVELKKAISLQFSGSPINKTEHRAVLHTALRDFKNRKPEVQETLQKMKEVSENIITGSWKGYTGKPITDVVNVGIGGSHLGPQMVTDALQFYKNHLNIHFISNVDGDHVSEVLQKVNKETTLFIIVSKSFTTQETLTNAQTIRKWLLEEMSLADIRSHTIAVSTNAEAVAAFGIAEENRFPMWDWVGGRFSLWSAVGLSICCAVGYDHFEEMLHGASAMDTHFSTTDFDENIPVLLALLSVWYNNFFEAESEAVIPYSQYLDTFVPYLQQAVMESNGKSVDRNGATIKYQTGTIVWGSTGTNAQHAFFQLLHQGTKLIPTDFIGFSQSLHGKTEHQDILMANCIAQTEALLYGTEDMEGKHEYQKFDGNRPTNTILIKKLTPKNLGSLIALYEHKLFVQGIVWNIFSYDQWGVELGKKLANDVLNTMSNSEQDSNNTSTKGLLDFLKS